MNEGKKLRSYCSSQKARASYEPSVTPTTFGWRPGLGRFVVDMARCMSIRRVALPTDPHQLFGRDIRVSDCNTLVMVPSLSSLDRVRLALKARVVARIESGADGDFMTQGRWRASGVRSNSPALLSRPSERGTAKFSAILSTFLRKSCPRVYDRGPGPVVYPICSIHRSRQDRTLSGGTQSGARCTSCAERSHFPRQEHHGGQLLEFP